MKKHAQILAFVLMLVMLMSNFVGCEIGGGDDDPVEIDTSKTQLYVYAINSGYKTKWLDAAIPQYEAAVANKSFEEGKMGVQIIPYTQYKPYPTLDTVKTDQVQEVWFLDTDTSVRRFVEAGAVADISAAYTTNNPYDAGNTKYPTLLSRIDEQAQESLKVDGKYYSIPFQHGSYGFVYNKDMFDEYGWYFDTEGELILFESNKTKSAGPNGISGDYDDGLPATYEQFFKLCDQIVVEGITPVNWTGTSYQMFLECLLMSLWTDYEGYEDMTNAFNFTGEQLLASIQNGELVLDEEKTAITDANGYEIFRQPGLYYAVKFIDRLISTGAYHNENAFSMTYKHTDSQDDFIYSGADPESREIAMLLEADWWMQEAYETFDAAADEGYGDEYDRNFRRMPLPKATEDKIGEAVTTFEQGVHYAVVSSKISEEKLAVAIDFLQFLNSSEQLVQYTKITNTLHPINYDISEEDYATLTPFAQSLVDYKLSEGATMARYITQSDTYYRYESVLMSWVLLDCPYKDKSGKEILYTVGMALHNRNDVNNPTGATPENYFENLYNYKKKMMQ